MPVTKKDSVPMIISGLVDSMSTPRWSRFFMTLRQLTLMILSGFETDLAFGLRTFLFLGVDNLWGSRSAVSDVTVESRSVYSSSETFALSALKGFEMGML